VRKIRYLYNRETERTLEYLKQRLHKVRVVLAGPQTIDKEHLGECYRDNGRIKIRIKANTRSIKKVLLHEILEAIAMILYKTNQVIDVNKNTNIEIFDHANIDRTVKKILKQK